MSPSKFQFLRQISPSDPHTAVSAVTHLEVTNARDLDLESTLQFVTMEGAVVFDFSVYPLVKEDGSNIEEERERIRREIAAFKMLTVSVQDAHDAFVAEAFNALDLLNGLAASV